MIVPSTLQLVGSVLREKWTGYRLRRAMRQHRRIIEKQMRREGQS